MEKVIVFGMGTYAESVINLLKKRGLFQVIGAWDNDSHKWGNKYEGYMVEKPNKELADQADIIMITSDQYFAEIQNQLIQEFGVSKARIVDRRYSRRVMEEIIVKKYNHSKDNEICRILDFIKENGLTVFNDSFTRYYDDLNVTVYQDEEKGLLYAYWSDKRMYFPAHYDTVLKVQGYLRQIMLEQDENSPHKYRWDSSALSRDAVIVDAGAAEGFFALEAIDYVQKIYLIEADEEWVKALQYTFADYKDKVKIINKYLSNTNDKDCITLDAIAENEKISMVKMDIEGAEIAALEGAKNLLANSRELLMLVCVYHNNMDLQKVIELSELNQCKVKINPGYMFYPWNDSNDLVLTRGVATLTKE